MRFLLALLQPIWLRLFNLYAIRGDVIAGRNLHLGIGSKIAAPTRLVIGNDVYIGKLCTIECDGEIGDELMVASAVGIVGRYDHDFGAVGVSIRNAPWVGDRDFARSAHATRVVIGSDVWIDYGAIVLSGITVGRGSIVAAGAAVTKDVRPYAIVSGNPAREVGTRFSPKIAARHEELIALGRKALGDAPMKKVRRPPHLSERMIGWGAALMLLVSTAGATVFGIPSNAQTATTTPNVPSSAATVASDDTATIEDAMKQASPGATVIIRPGTYRIAHLAVTPNTILYAPQGATIIGDLVARGPKTVIRGFTFAGGTIDISNSQSVSIGDCAFNGGTTAIKLDDASNALIINNDFHRVTGGVITGWGLDQSTISGNHFFDCGQCINLDFNVNGDQTRGRNIVIERNIFMGTARMAVEVGPIGAYTQDLVVRDNWAADFKNRGPDPGDTMSTFVAYSVVPTRGVNSVIRGNYAIAGDRGRGAIGIELAGSGEIVGNYIQNFDYGAIVYSAGFNVHENTFVNTTQAPVLNYAKRSGHIAGNRTADPMLNIARPERRIWSP